MRKFLSEISFAARNVVKPVHHCWTSDKKDMRKRLDELPPLPPLPVACDNKGTVFSVNNPDTSTKAQKHVALKYYRTRDEIRLNNIRVNYISTHMNVADFFTKELPNQLFTDFKRVLMGSVGQKK